MSTSKYCSKLINIVHMKQTVCPTKTKEAHELVQNLELGMQRYQLFHTDTPTMLGLDMPI